MASDRFQPLRDDTPGDTTGVTPTISGRVERTVLRAEVAALKSELERREHTLGRVVEQYEHLLEARSNETGDHPTDRNDRRIATALRALTGLRRRG